MFGADFYVNSILLGVGLAMDAFSVSIANGLREPHMKASRMLEIAGVYSFFQFLMPVLGWTGVNFVTDIFEGFTKAIPWIALILLCFIGGKMVYEGIRDLKNEEKAQEDGKKLSFLALIIQGIATSIDALSTGFAIADYDVAAAFFASAIIAMVTLLVCIVGVKLGRYFGKKLKSVAVVLGGLILIFIGFKIWFGMGSTLFTELPF
mgnify:CR=1 FL=1